MAASPDFKIYTPDGQYEAACKHAEVAAGIVALLGKGATVRWGHRYTLWTEGADGSAGESYDAAAATMHARIDEINRKNHAKVYSQ